jgi:hypothetical protein
MAPGGIFHPKVFLFHRADSSTAWIGSANLTDGGFIRNVEVVWEVSPADAVSAWFDNLWDGLSADSETTIAQYEKTWTRPPFDPQLSGGGLPKETYKRPIDRPTLKNGFPSNWAEYLEALNHADRFWRKRSEKGGHYSVLGETFSWMHTIKTVELIARRSSWVDFADRERWALLGMAEDDGTWGLLGSMRGAGAAKQIFRGNTKINREVLSRLRDALTPLLAAQGTAEAINAACECLTTMVKESGISQGVATRLMACARPDVAVSVNAGSAPYLGALTGLPETPSSLARIDNYRKLLQWVANQPWYNSPEPASDWEASIWRMRAALIDCFVYEPL